MKPSDLRSMATSVVLFISSALPLSCVGSVGGQADGSAGTGPGGGAGGPGGGATNGSMAANDPALDNFPFEPLAPRAYVAKVKDALTGLPLEASDLQAVTANPMALRGLIDMWMARPEFQEKMMDFLTKAFQQTQVGNDDFDSQFHFTMGAIPQAQIDLMVKSQTESFARTAWSFISEGKPFTETVTTTRYMLNVPLMVTLAYMDSAPQDDNGDPLPATNSWLLTKFPNFKYTQVGRAAAGGARNGGGGGGANATTAAPQGFPLTDIVNPQSPNFLTFTMVVGRQNGGTRCPDPLTANGTKGLAYAFRGLFGGRAEECATATMNPSVFTQDDWNTWRMVNIRVAGQGEDRTLFWDIPKLRDTQTTELALQTPRVGFMTTPAFLANWPTNTSNQYRLTLNQALIVGLGYTLEDRTSNVPVTSSADDEAMHVQPGTTCYGCHQTLDPMRDFFKQDFSLSYSQQLNMNDPKNPIPMEGVFNLPGNPPIVRGNGVNTLAKAMVQNPLFASAWAQKLCQYVNAAPCSNDDPEFIRVAKVFKDSKYDFKALVRELFSSPLVTFAQRTKTAKDQGIVISIARRETLCARLSNRLGVTDVCNQTGHTALDAMVAEKVSNFVQNVPGAGYARAESNAMIPHDPNMFFTDSAEKTCTQLATVLVEGTKMSKWSVANKEQAITDFVSTVMGVPDGDSRAPMLRELLASHYTSAAQAEMPADALRSTFVVACSSPVATSSGL